MFNKRAKRNFRQRRHDSSDEEGDKRDGDGAEDEKQAPESAAGRVALSPEVGIPKAESCGHEDAADPTIPTRRNILSFSDDKEADGWEFKVRKSADKEVLFKARKKDRSPAGELSPHVREDGDPISVSSEEDSKDLEEHGGSDSSSQTSTSSGESVPRPGVIPNARQIRAAKKQRRKARAQKDYIPLDGESCPGASDGDDDDEDDDEEDDIQRNSSDDTDDHQRRIQFAPKSKTIRERIAETIGGSESENCSINSEEEDDWNQWEEQQIGKGVKGHKLLDSGSPPQDSVKHKKKADIPLSLPTVGIDAIKKRISAKLESLREVYRAHEAECRRMQLDIESSRASLEQLEGGSLDEQHRFYRGMRVYVQNLIECLTEKIVLINAAELDLHTLLIDQAEALLSRRREAVRKESSHLQQLAYNTDPVTSDTAEKSLAEIPKQRETGQQEAESEGEAADGEPLAHEKVELDYKRAEILKRTQEIFADVQVEFHDVKKILSRFAEWRDLFSESYYNAYINLCMPKLLGPLIRHQLIGWNPLKVNSEDFESLPWYSAVEKFCYGPGYEISDKMDRETLPSIIQKTILPKVEGFVELIWDPLSSEQSLCLTGLCRRLQNDYNVFDGEQSRNAKALLEAVATRMRSAVDEDVFIPLYPKKFLVDKGSTHYRFQERQLCSAVKLLGNVTLWDGFVPEDVLMELALDKLLNRYIMMLLLNAPPEKESLEKCKKIAASFPKSWFLDVETRCSIPQLQNFCRHVLQVTHSLCGSSPDAGSQREIISDVLTLLRKLKALDSVTAITEEYNYQDI